MPYQILEHPTDLKLKVSGANIVELFKNAAIGLFRAIDGRKNPAPASGQWRDVQVSAPDQESLLVEWLNELLSLHDIENENYFDIKIFDLTDDSIIAQARGAPSTRDRFDVKAATYHGLEIKQTPQGYEATILFDI